MPLRGLVAQLTEALHLRLRRARVVPESSLGTARFQLGDVLF
jgi:hypothetical protein